MYARLGSIRLIVLYFRFPRIAGDMNCYCVRVYGLEKSERNKTSVSPGTFHKFRAEITAKNLGRKNESSVKIVLNIENRVRNSTVTLKLKKKKR